MESTTSNTRLIPLNQWPDFHPWPSVSGLRHLYFNRDRNGFNAVARKVGGRVLVDEAAFFQWVEKQSAKASA